MLIKVALNGGRPGAPATAEEIAEDVAACAAAGATVFHVHPRGAGGMESLLPADADRVVAAIRAKTPHVSLGLTSGAWILPDVSERLDALAHWQTLPDFASVNFDEEGCELVARLLVERGIGVEAGILDAASTRRFLAAQIPVVRVLIELQEQRLDDALRAIDPILAVLGDHPAPRLLHGHGAMAWELLDEAARRGYDSRIGLEDVATLPDGRAATNVELFTAAVARCAQDPDLEPIFIAGNVREIQAVEDLLTAEEIEYEVRPEAFGHAIMGGVCYQGLLFLVLGGQAEYCRRLLLERGLTKGLVPRQS